MNANTNLNDAGNAVVPATVLESPQVELIDPATVSLYVAIGASLLNFAGTLIGGKTGDALTSLSGSLNNLNFKMQQLGQQLDAIVTGINEAISSIDQSKISQIAAAHDQMLAYQKSFPNGVPQVADANNINYALANQNTHDAISYFQSVNRGVFMFMPSLCHVTNTRLEVASTSWPCWFARSNPGQPAFTGELNTSSGRLSSLLSQARAQVAKAVTLKPIQERFDDPPLLATIGWMVVDGEQSKVVFSAKNPDDPDKVRKAADTFRTSYVTQKANSMLSNYSGTNGQWTSLVAAHASAGIQRALDLGDAKMFLRYINPDSLVMEDTASAQGVNSAKVVPYRPLPMRDVLLDMLTSKAFRDRHGLLVKGADKKSVRFWFEKAFHREPSPGELQALIGVVEIFGFDSLFAAIAYSGEYERRYGDGIPVSFTGDNTLLGGTPVKQSQ